MSEGHEDSPVDPKANFGSPELSTDLPGQGVNPLVDENAANQERCKPPSADSPVKALQSVLTMENPMENNDNTEAKDGKRRSPKNRLPMIQCEVAIAHARHFIRNGATSTEK
jgi:hypothetical protein